MAARVLLAQVLHEANTFNRFPRTLAGFELQGCHFGADVPAAFASTTMEMAGFLEAARDRGGAIETPVATTLSVGGIVARDAFERFRDAMLDSLRALGRADGILVALHGAMVAEGEDDADGALLAALREAAGPGTPIVVTLDLHANVSDRMAAMANAIVPYRTNPHTDRKETALRAAAILADAMAGRTRPRVSIARAPQMFGFDRGRTFTGHGPMIDALATARRLEREVPGIIEIGILAGYSYADVWEVGPSVCVTGDGDDPRHLAVARELMAEGRQRRDEETSRLLGVAEAVALMREGRAGAGPVIVADFADAPGAGAHGDATGLLRGMIEGGVRDAFGTIFAPRAASRAREAGVGARLRLAFGGWIDPRHGGPPIEAEVEVLRLSDGRYVHEGPYAKGMTASFGPSALVRAGGVDVILASEPVNIWDRQQFLIYGIDPAAKAAIGLKCMHAFRAAFEPIAARTVDCDGGGIASSRYAERGY
ncbi:MAG: M81 family metallopeptidase, partial [Alphaproteobacteria bacterium]